jgi:hypothetical protein
MISYVTGEVSFLDGIHISPRRSIWLLRATERRFEKEMVRHILGIHPSDHGAFEVEVHTRGLDCIQLVLLAHQHPFYQPSTPRDAERRVFHEGVIGSDLAGQREFSWGKVACNWESACNKNWLGITYSRDTGVPLHEPEVLLRLFAHKDIPDEST